MMTTLDGLVLEAAVDVEEYLENECADGKVHMADLLAWRAARHPGKARLSPAVLGTALRGLGFIRKRGSSVAGRMGYRYWVKE